MQLGGPGAGGDGVVPAAVDFAYVEPDEPAAQDWKVAVRADGPDSATPVRLMGVESTRSVPRAAAPPARRAAAQHCPASRRSFSSASVAAATRGSATSTSSRATAGAGRGAT